MGRTCAMSKYQITLTPVDRFFFGGEMTFKVEGKESFNERYSSYIIRSSMFPQQTSLLGMLRFLILRNAGDEFFKDGRIQDKDKAKKLIGAQSFSVNNNHDKNDFKKIKGISHVRIRRKIGTQVLDLEFAPLFKELSFYGASDGSYNLKEFRIPAISPKEYNAKDGLPYLLTDGVKTYQLEEIFIEDRRVGIDRNIYTGKTDDGALFKQVSYRFSDKSNYCFVFDVEVNDDIEFKFDSEKYNGQMVSVGADNSQFIINISDKIIVNDDIRPMNNAIYLLSPTFLERKEARKGKFAVTKLVSFRFLESQMDKTDSYHILSGNLTRSPKYELYAPGSVFYFENSDQRQAFIKAIESKKEFRQIGYNEYK